MNTWHLKQIMQKRLVGLISLALAYSQFKLLVQICCMVPVENLYVENLYVCWVDWN